MIDGPDDLEQMKKIAHARLPHRRSSSKTRHGARSRRDSPKKHRETRSVAARAASSLPSSTEDNQSSHVEENQPAKGNWCTLGHHEWTPLRIPGCILSSTTDLITDLNRLEEVPGETNVDKLRTALTASDRYVYICIALALAILLLLLVTSRSTGQGGRDGMYPPPPYIMPPQMYPYPPPPPHHPMYAPHQTYTAADNQTGA